MKLRIGLHVSSSRNNSRLVANDGALLQTRLGSLVGSIKQGLFPTCCYNCYDVFVVIFTYYVVCCMFIIINIENNAQQQVQISEE
jgi:hypothetical protein